MNELVVKAMAEGSPRALCEVDRLRRNPERLANAERGVGRTPEGKGGPNRSIGFHTLPREEWSPYGIEPRKFNMIDTNL